uniref:Uncharacterized protein n=1 Tax=Kwoniella bestiolae CBS 10118 TaxID=1296100 RepID=A0A1B9G486_9TREE|nr:hypothetical protein I302_03485 [Kwoniella bestiolae CBS 10118]OCF25812.1 hypothetical protein I302_03485 [Kwoniella bestiolae CBS 10118]
MLRTIGELADDYISPATGDIAPIMWTLAIRLRPTHLCVNLPEENEHGIKLLSELLAGPHVGLVNLPCLGPNYMNDRQVAGELLVFQEKDYDDNNLIESERTKLLGWAREYMTITSKEDAEPCVCCGKKCGRVCYPILDYSNLWRKLM